MKHDTKSNIRLMLSVVAMLFGAGTGVVAQTTQPQSQTDPVQAQTQNIPANQVPDFRLLNLTPDQVQKIRTINMDLKDERQTANQKLRQAQRALAEAVESPTPDEALIAQRSREVAEAQANTIRLRSLTEARILQVLTPEQRMKLREMRQRNLAQRRANQQQQSPNGLGQRQGLQRGANAPLAPNQRRILKRQQRP
jgi:Spy/CpxP family protein refolding chaperone